MEVETQSHVQAARTTRSASITPRVPIRLFLLSDHRVLREALARFLKSQPGVRLVASRESSLNSIAEIANSTCDVLLVDPVNASTLNILLFDHLEHGLSNLRIVMIDMDASVADVTSTILSDPLACQDLCQEEGRDPATGNS